MSIGDLSQYSIMVGGHNITNTANVTVAELNIYEDMESPTGPFGDMFIIDGGDFMGKNNITGRESVAISFTSNDFNSSVNLTLSLNQSNELKPGSHQGMDGHGGGSLYHKEYTWKLCHPAYIWCQGNYVNQDFKDTCSSIVSQVVQYAFKSQCDTPDQTEPQVRMLARFEHPLKFLDRVIDWSISTKYKSSLYLLYFNRSVFVYETYENAFNRSSGVTLTMKNTLSTGSATLDDMRKQIMWFHADAFYRPVRPQNMGYIVTYNMGSGETGKGEPGPGGDVGYPWNKTPGTTHIYTAAPVEVTGVPQFLVISSENTPFEFQLAMAKRFRVAFQAQLAQNHLTFQCVGNPSIQIGTWVRLQIPDCCYGSEQIDRTIGGTWLVKSINHKIRGVNQTPCYLMICECVRIGYNGVSGGEG